MALFFRLHRVDDEAERAVRNHEFGVTECIPAELNGTLRGSEVIRTIQARVVRRGLSRRHDRERTTITLGNCEQIADLAAILSVPAKDRCR